MARRGRIRNQSTMTYTEERVAAETGRVLLALYRAGLEVHLTPDGLSGQASARIVAGPRSRRRSPITRTARGTGDSPLAAICAAVERLNERSGAIVVALDE
jgi:antitoxin (DNA-binding transcriptional repressor) of toxin-antitoxin stability system